MKLKSTDIIVALAVLLIVLLIIIPLSPGVLDMFLIINISLSLIVLLTALFIKETLEFSTFPTLLLLFTLFRIALNINATRLIIGNGGQAGGIISAFGGFVTGSNQVVGVVVFVIIIIVQFMIITKGSERVAEVAARFALDAMPGKQMAIDADLNTGVITEEEARRRRKDVQRESDFYGSMDGASKFVKGDAIVGILIVVVNLVGGVLAGILGLTGETLTFEEAINVYLQATIGNGLVNQIPALLVSTASGIIVTRSSNAESFSSTLTSQLFGKPSVLFVIGGMLGLLSVVPGMPTLLMLLFAIGLPAAGYYTLSNRKKAEEAAQSSTAAVVAEEKRKPESVTSLLQVDLIEMEFGYGILSLVDASQGGDLLDRVVMIRRQCALELGIIVPVVRLRDNIQLPTNGYSIKIKGIEVAGGEVIPDHFMALRPADAEDGDEIDGIETVDPAFGLPALWVSESEREKAELYGYTTIDAPSVIATHLMEVIKKHADELMGRQQVQVLIDNLKTQQPALVEEVVPKLFSIGEVQKVLANLLHEGVSIRDISSVLEILGDYGTITRDLEILTEYVRQGLKRAISRKFVPNNKARVITLDAALEQLIADNIRQTDRGSYVALEPIQIQKILFNTKKVVERAVGNGSSPIVLTAPAVRRFFRQIVDQMDTDLVVLSYSELERDVEIFSDGVVSI
ncbi:MAG TPA: flagellar biosynthesis protein FlhA [Clostridia bacterium]|nr:flagellar biosynthesis protein FlhA [Clostridia bacterium]